MANKNKDHGQDIPHVGRGAGGAGRVAGFLSDESAEDTSGTLRRLLQELKGKQVLFLFVLFLSLTASVTQIFSPMLIGNMINYIVEGFDSGAGLNWSGISRIAMILIILYVINFAARYLAQLPWCASRKV